MVWKFQYLKSIFSNFNNGGGCFMNVLSFGEVLWDVYPDARFIGGAPMNVAAHIAKHGHNVYLLSAVGDDELGRMTAERLSHFGIRTDYVRVHPDKPTGSCLVTLDEQSVPSYDLQNDTAWDDITVDLKALADMDVLYFGTLAQRSEQNRRTLDALLQSGRFREVFVDINIRPPFCDAENIIRAFSHATIVKISEEELPTVVDALGLDGQKKSLGIIDEITKRFDNIRIIILTRGEKGALAIDTETGETCGVPAVRTTVVSTVGAGDSFSAAFLSAFDQNKDLGVCLSYAARVAAWVVSHKEAVPEETVPV